MTDFIRVDPLIGSIYRHPATKNAQALVWEAEQTAQELQKFIQGDKTRIRDFGTALRHMRRTLLQAADLYEVVFQIIPHTQPRTRSLIATEWVWTLCRAGREGEAQGAAKKLLGLSGLTQGAQKTLTTIQMLGLRAVPIERQELWQVHRP